MSETLEPTIEDARWLSKDNIHLTLKFLGSTPEESIDTIQSAIDNGIAGFRKFYFSLGELGGFPSANRARVLWVGVHHGAKKLVTLSHAVDEALAPLGFEPEKKPFKPHITLARIKTPTSISDAISKAPSDLFAGRLVNVDGVTIFQSRVRRSGAEYESLRFIPLPG